MHIPIVQNQTFGPNRAEGRASGFPRQWAGFSHEHHHTHSFIIHPIHSSISIHPFYPFYPPFRYNCTIAYFFLYLLHEFHTTGTSSDSSRLYFLYMYTYIHAAAAIGSQPSVIVGGYWLSHRLSGSGWAGQYDNRTGRLSPLIFILLSSLRSLSCRSLPCQSLDDNHER